MTWKPCISGAAKTMAAWPPRVVATLKVGLHRANAMNEVGIPNQATRIDFI